MIIRCITKDRLVDAAVVILIALCAFVAGQ